MGSWLQVPIGVVAVGAVSIALALSIGANNSAAEMGPAYGSGVRSRREAVALIAVFCTAGATLAGHRVMTTVGQDLVGGGILTGDLTGVLIVVISAMVLIGLANILRVPIATSHAVVGAVVGLGLFYQAVNVPLVAAVVAWWIGTPVLALVLAFATGRFFYPRLLHAFGRFRSERAVNRVLAWSVTLSSCGMAFAAGSNSVAKAMGPAVGAGIFQPSSGAILGRRRHGGRGVAVGGTNDADCGQGDHVDLPSLRGLGSGDLGFDCIRRLSLRDAGLSRRDCDLRSHRIQLCLGRCERNEPGIVMCVAC